MKKGRREGRRGSGGEGERSWGGIGGGASGEWRARTGGGDGERKNKSGTEEMAEQEGITEEERAKA
jgi:hypothetical protein